MAIMNIEITIASQRLDLLADGEIVRTYSVSTAALGTGQSFGSHQTPLGWHEVAEKIGETMPFNTVFVGRRPTGEVYTPELAGQHPGRDWILTRILWLAGLEDGVNKGGQVDTKSRFIYIHGTPDSEPMGVPLSHGCIRMRNDDVMEVFDMVSVGDRVIIRLAAF